jgi:methionyl aminopeptidase
MGIIVKNKEQINGIRKASRLAAKVLDFITPYIKQGVSTEEINKLCHDYILSHNAIPAPLNYHGFPKSVCTSINNVVCHGIPSPDEILRNGDIINVDVTVILNGYFGDTSRMYTVGDVMPEAQLLVDRTYKAMMKGISVIRNGVYLNQIGKTIEEYVCKFNYGIVRDYAGHGIGLSFHEEPQVSHYDMAANGPRLLSGMTLTVEPMINVSPNWRTELDENDGWTVYTKDNALSAQFEHTVLVTDKGFEILTVS